MKKLFMLTLLLGVLLMGCNNEESTETVDKEEVEEVLPEIETLEILLENYEVQRPVYIETNEQGVIEGTYLVDGNTYGRFTTNESGKVTYKHVINSGNIYQYQFLAEDIIIECDSDGVNDFDGCDLIFDIDSEAINQEVETEIYSTIRGLEFALDGDYEIEVEENYYIINSNATYKLRDDGMELLVENANSTVKVTFDESSMLVINSRDDIPEVITN